jgi:hypothetical protein
MDRITPLALSSPEAESWPFQIAPEVRRSLSGLALAVNHGLEDEQLRVYAFALRDVPVPMVRKACLALASTERFWPKVAEIRAKAQAMQEADVRAETERIKRLAPTPGADEPTYSCPRCLDEPAGWILLRCPSYRCGRDREHDPHVFTVRCPHWLRENGPRLRLYDEKRQADRKPSTAEYLALMDLEAGRYRFEAVRTMR